MDDIDFGGYGCGRGGEGGGEVSGKRYRGA